jgi:hypothetical protein
VIVAARTVQPRRIPGVNGLVSPKGRPVAISSCTDDARGRLSRSN